MQQQKSQDVFLRIRPCQSRRAEIIAGFLFIYKNKRVAEDIDPYKFYNNTIKMFHVKHFYTLSSVSSSIFIKGNAKEICNPSGVLRAVQF